MPWRKYIKTDGKNGPIYQIFKGVRVCLGADGKWRLFSEKNGKRNNITFGNGREALIKAIKAGEDISLELRKFSQIQSDDAQTVILPTFLEYGKQWLENNSGRWDITTCQRYEEILRLYFEPSPELKNKQLNEVSRQVIKTFLIGVFKTRSAATVEVIHTVISGIFEDAIEDKLVMANPCKGLLKKILPPLRQRNVSEPDPFELSERDVFLECAQKHFSLQETLILRVMLFMGLRLGESLSMRSRYFDFRKKTYTVNESFKHYRFSKPKKGKKRIVDVPEFLIKEIQKYTLLLREENMRNGSSEEVDLLFQDKQESGCWPFSQRKIQALVKKVCKKAGLRIRTPHDLRHTYATILLMAHQSPAYVQRQMGHSKITTTVDTYCHWISGEGRQGLENALLGTVPNAGEIAYFSHMQQSGSAN